MACIQLCVSDKGQIVACNDCELSLCSIAKKLNCYYTLIDVFLKNQKKTVDNYQKENHDHKRKTSASDVNGLPIKY